MEWDLGILGIGLLVAMSIAFGLLAQLTASAWSTRWIGVVGAVVYFLAGILVSEVWFGWATEVDLQPNIDGLSFDEVLLITTPMSVGVTLGVAWLVRFVRKPRASTHAGRHMGGHTGGHPA